MSCVNPRLTTTRRAARSVRFSGNVYAGTCQPRSRSALETSNTVKFSTSSLSVKAKTGELVASCHQLERPELRDARRQPHGYVPCVPLHLAVPLEAEADEVVVLRDHLRDVGGSSPSGMR